MKLSSSIPPEKDNSGGTTKRTDVGWDPCEPSQNPVHVTHGDWEGIVGKQVVRVTRAACMQARSCRCHALRPFTSTQRTSRARRSSSCICTTSCSEPVACSSATTGRSPGGATRRPPLRAVPQRQRGDAQRRQRAEGEYVDDCEASWLTLAELAAL